MEEAVYDSAVQGLLTLSGDEKMKIFTIQRAFLNILGFNWFEGGIGLFLPGFLKHNAYRCIYPSWMIVTGILTLDYALRFQDVFIQKINGYICSMTFFSAALKIIVFNIYGSRVKKLYEEVEALGVLNAKTPKIEGHLKVGLSYAALVFSNAMTWSLWWLLVHADIPFGITLPWESKGFNFLFTVQVGFLAACFCALCHILVDTTFQMLVAGITFHIDRLSELLSQLGSNQKKLSDDAIMASAVDLHVELLKIANLLAAGYSDLFVCQSVYTVVHSCILLYGAVNVDNKVEVVMNQGTMLATSYAQLLVYCFYGDLLTSKFEELLFSSYDNAWYQSPLKVKKSLAHFSKMTHRRISLRGFGGVQPSLSNWLHSLQDSVSYFLFLKTVTTEV
ncbi:Hypothetical protein NTJ_00931 [Nesidiocoris tenuis]|uniref:Odorant receptor n=1 Tax=Nesidiocoris tenuis TaxID=355587 RepID=A0ABN7ABA8_9HEMI|nr:Hypothetical protein NTJ_00931 [Nesidiocoris tenuis]